MSYNDDSALKIINRAFQTIEENKWALKDEEIKEILHDVLTELYYSKGKKPIQNPLVWQLAID